MKRMEPLNRQELLNLLAAARQDSVRDWCLLLLMYSHGLRASEVGSLKRADLNERNWTLSIERLKGSDKTLQVIYPNSTKPLNARKAISEWLAIRPQSPYLFPNRQGERLSRIAVYNAFKKHALASGLAAHKASPHALKHTLGQNLHDSGHSIEVVAACLGHPRIDSSRRYFDISSEDANQARQVAIST